LNETLLWLLYLVSAIVAFLTVQRLGWRIVPSMLAGTLVTLIGWVPLYLLTAEDKRPEFWRLDLSLNASFALIFAGVGAALAFAMKDREAR
jgi:hypothetical protein